MPGVGADAIGRGPGAKRELVWGDFGYKSKLPSNASASQVRDRRIFAITRSFARLLRV
jgi:hypothetical protein